MDIFDIVKRSELENNGLFIKQIYYKTVRKRFTDLFGKLYCEYSVVAKALIGIYVDCSNCDHPVDPTYDEKYFEILIYVKNVLVWLDFKNIDARSDISNIVKTNDIKVGEEISEINLYSTLTNLNTDSLEQGCITPVACAVSSEHKDSLKNNDLILKNTNELENCSNNTSHNPSIHTTVYKNVNNKKKHLGDIDVSSNKEDNITEVDCIQKKDNNADEENSLLERSFNSAVNSVDDGYIDDFKKKKVNPVQINADKIEISLISYNNKLNKKSKICLQNKFTGKRSKSDSHRVKKIKKLESSSPNDSIQNTSISDTVEIKNVDTFGPDDKSDVQLVTSESKKSSKRTKRNSVGKVEIKNVDSFEPNNKKDVQLVTSEPKKSSKRNFVRKVEIKNVDSFEPNNKKDVQLVTSESKKSKRNSVGKVEIKDVDTFGPDIKSDVQLVTSESKKSSKRNFVGKVEIKNVGSFEPDNKNDVQLVTSEPKKSSKRNSVEKVCPDHTNDLKNTVLTNVHSRNSKGETQIHSYSAKGKLFSVMSLLNDGANPNVVDNAGWTPLHEAVKRGHLQIVKLLIEYGAFLNVPGFEYETPLFTAIKYEQFDIAKLLLQKGANSKCTNIYGINAQNLNVDMWLKLSEFDMSCTSSKLIEIPYTPDKIAIFLKNVNSVIVERFGTNFNAKLITEKSFKNQFKQITHIIVPASKSNTCEMSYEILMGIANGICIVNANWLVDSLKGGVLIPCNSYEVKGTMSFVNYNGPKMARLSKQNLIPKLFNGIEIHIAGSSDWENFSIDQLKEIVLEFGAKVLKRMPNPEDRPSNVIPYHCRNSEQMRHVSTIVLYTEDSKRLIKYNMNHLKVFPIAWFMEAAQKYRIDYYT